MIVLPPLLRDPAWCNTGLRRYGNTGGLGSLDPSQSPGLVTDETREAPRLLCLHGAAMFGWLGSAPDLWPSDISQHRPSWVEGGDCVRGRKQP
jgi:hypothetical protein